MYTYISIYIYTYILSQIDYSQIVWFGVCIPEARSSFPDQPQTNTAPADHPFQKTTQGGAGADLRLLERSHLPR